MRGAQEAAPRFSAFLNLTYSRFVPEHEKPDWAGEDAVLFCAIDQQCVVRRGTAEPVSYRDVPCVATRPGVAENFLTTDAQDKAKLVIMGVASFAKDSVWNGKKQQVSRPMFQDANPRPWKNFDWTGQARVELSLGIRASSGVAETVPRGIVTGAGAYTEEPLSQTEQVGNLQ